MLEFPEKWYIKITDDNRHVVNPWKIKQQWKDDLFENLDYLYVTEEGSGETGLVGWDAGRNQDRLEITTSQFEEWVLKSSIFSNIEDNNNDRLKEILKSYNKYNGKIKNE